jgi:hypothetical protein
MLGVFAFVLPLLLATAASGSSPPSFLSAKPPYSSASAYLHTVHSFQRGCGSSESAIAASAVNLTAGRVFVASVNVSVSTCNSTMGSAEFLGYAGIGYLNFTVTSNGTYNFTAHWHLGVNVSLGTSSRSSTGDRAQFSLSEIDEVVDLTHPAGTYSKDHSIGMRTLTNGVWTKSFQNWRAESIGPIHLSSTDSYQFFSYLVYQVKASYSPSSGQGHSAWAHVSPTSGGSFVSSIVGN